MNLNDIMAKKGCMRVGNDGLQEKIGIRIAYIRKLHGWDQEQLAEKVGFTRSYVSKLESGNSGTGVPLDTYIVIANVFNMPLWKLIKVDES
jgi:transcriptional regulator with XRE-family HTH domain